MDTRPGIIGEKNPPKKNESEVNEKNFSFILTVVEFFDSSQFLDHSPGFGSVSSYLIQ